MPDSWDIWVDTGGTFTDCIARDSNERVHRAKVLSSGALRGRISNVIGPERVQIESAWNVCDDFVTGFHFHLLNTTCDPIQIVSHRARDATLQLDVGADDLPLREGAAFEVRSDEPAPIIAARLVTQTPAGVTLPPCRMRLATTRGTNALLERRGAPAALFITRGFRDLLVIRNQQRPDIFALRINRPSPFYEHVIEVDERLDADGSVLNPLDPEAIRSIATKLYDQGVQSAAVALLHSYRNPAHEQQVREVLRDVGFPCVACSADLAPLIRIVPRAETAVIDSYLAPNIQTYLDDVSRSLADHRLHVMTSAGGLVSAERYRACTSLLSGPAGGVAGAAAAGRASGCSRIISFDMGGTSTDVARYDHDFEYRFEHAVGEAHILAPSLAIETVAAGGGSICTFSEDRLRVGPESAGASPGPACYGAGGPLTLTDVNLLLGRLSADQFEIPLDVNAARCALDELIQAIANITGHPPDHIALLMGMLDLANERMADAIEEISLRRGYDPADDALVAFGGAGGQHACAIAERLGITHIIMPADASLLSAVGLGGAVIERFAQQQILQSLHDVEPQLHHILEQLAADARREVEAEGVTPHDIHVRRRIINMRLAGQDTTLAIDMQSGKSLHDLFAARYDSMYGQPPHKTDIEVESVRVVASSHAHPFNVDTRERNLHDVSAQQQTRALFNGQWIDVPTYQRSELAPGATFKGPALVFDRRSAFVIEQRWSAHIDSADAIVLKQVKSSTQDEIATRSRLVEEALFANRFATIAEQMGRMLERTALSTNVKERLDFSCTLLSAHGELVANAPHMPVHLGAMGLCVRALRKTIDMQPGDVIITNHPAYGGSHLPDITVVTPVFDDQQHLLGYVASRAHHAEIGGTRPGSMPPDARSLVEEGVVLPPMHLIRDHQSQFASIERTLRQSPYPSRQVDDNIADLRAQVAANHFGAKALRELAQQHGRSTIAQQIDALKQRAARLAGRALREKPDGAYNAIEYLDDGSPIAVSITIADTRATIDFTGTASQHPGNLNATPAIVRSAIIYVLRLMIGENLPLNEGLMQAVDVNIPRGLLNPLFPDDPAKCPAVVGGNVETSQRLVDTLLKALQLSACSQGTMNNTLFGNERFGYYETVCGGSGAGPGFHGTDAVHTHMTNTRITDPEVLEHRYPVRVERFGIREGSGGDGQYRGGNGAIRELTFLEPVALSMVTQHRTQRPFGMSGGNDGATGRQRIVRTDGTVQDLKSIDGCTLHAGDRLMLETPGGGGWGQ